MFKKYRHKESGKLAEVRGFGNRFDLTPNGVVSHKTYNVKEEDKKVVTIMIEEEFLEQYEPIEE